MKKTRKIQNAKGYSNHEMENIVSGVECIQKETEFIFSDIFKIYSEKCVSLNQLSFN